MSNKTLKLRSRSIGFPENTSCSSLFFFTFYLVFRPTWKAASRGNVQATRYIVPNVSTARKRKRERGKNLRHAAARA